MPEKPSPWIVMPRSTHPAARGQRIESTAAHDLANFLAGITIGLERLRGCQRTNQLNEVVECMLRAAERGAAATQILLRAANNRCKGAEPGDARKTWLPQRHRWGSGSGDGGARRSQVGEPTEIRVAGSDDP
jgi:hypothetical protein